MALSVGTALVEHHLLGPVTSSPVLTDTYTVKVQNKARAGQEIVHLEVSATLWLIFEIYEMSHTDQDADTKYSICFLSQVFLHVAQANLRLAILLLTLQSTSTVGMHHPTQLQSCILEFFHVAMYSYFKITYGIPPCDFTITCLPFLIDSRVGYLFILLLHHTI